jgi:homoserine/homoserine lactone efflux protein
LNEFSGMGIVHGYLDCRKHSTWSNPLNCISTSAEFGFRKGIWSVVGVFIAANIHMAFALAGLATFIAANPVVFEFIKWLGVGYLAWMGLSMLRSRGTLSSKLSTRLRTNRQLVIRAILISLSNPKAIFAWLAVFAQFIDATNPLGSQLAILAPSALVVNVVVYLGYSFLGIGAKTLITKNRKLWFDRLTGSLYLAFALGLASADIRKS